MSAFRSFLMASLSLFLCVACVGTDVGNPQHNNGTTPDAGTNNTPGEAKVELGFTAFDETMPGALTLASGVEIDRALVVVSDVRMRPISSCDSEEPDSGGETDAGESETDDDRLVIEGPFLVDLVASSNDLPPFMQQHGAYCRIKMDLDPLPEQFGDLPAETSILVEGSAADGTPFRLELASKKELELRARNEIRLAAARHAFVVAFASNEWFSNATLEAAERTDGVIVIDEATNSEVYEAFEDAFDRSQRLFEDVDGDGVLSAAERAAPLAESN